jgi:putative DNA primase/helicase
LTGLGLREIARALGGEVTGRQVLAPGPNHSRRDRSLSVRISSDAPGGFIVASFADDSFDICRDYVADRLGLPSDFWRTKGQGPSRPAPTFTPREPGPEPDHAARIARAVTIWHEAVPAQGTVVARYLASRGLDLPEGADVLRFHPRCPWRDEAENRTIYVPAMVAAMRSVTTDEPQGIHRTRLSADGAKVGRRMLGIAAGAAVKLDADDAVTTGLHIAEGIETALAARQLGFRPCWALASAGGIKGFPVLRGVEVLTILGENDDANRRAVEECAMRWHQAGREVVVVEPASGSDILDAMRGAV